MTRLRAAARKALNSRKGKNVLLYMLFVCVAFVFWVFLSLDTEIQRDFEVPVEIENVPDSVIIIGDVPKQFNVVVQAKGSQLLSFMWGRVPTLKIKFAVPNGGGNNRFYLSKAKLNASLRDYFGQGVHIISMRPDSLGFHYTSSAGTRLPVKVVTDIKPNFQCIVSGPVRCSTDSVTVYSVGQVPHDLTEIVSEPVVLNGIKDTVKVDVPLKVPAGLRVIPDHVTLIVPVEPLISKHGKAMVEVRNLPEGMGMITFPSSVNVNYLVPMSHYNEEYPFKVYADYNSLKPGSQKIKVNIAISPGIFRNVTIKPDSVEYILEKNEED